MSKQRALELLRVAVPQLDALIITGRQDGLSIVEKADWFDRCCVSLDDFGLDVGARVPQSDGVIVRRAGKYILIGRESDAWYFFGMSIEGEIAFGVINVPQIDVIICARWGDVLAADRKRGTGRGWRKWKRSLFWWVGSAGARILSTLAAFQISQRNYIIKKGGWWRKKKAITRSGRALCTFRLALGGPASCLWLFALLGFAPSYLDPWGASSRFGLPSAGLFWWLRSCR